MHRQEVAALSETVALTWEQELVARDEARGRSEDRLETLRETLRLLLEEWFGPLPASLAAQSAATEDTERLRNAVRQVVHLNSLDELAL